MADFVCASSVHFSTDSGQPLTVDELVTLQIVRGGPLLRQQREVVRHPDGRRLPILLSAVALDAALLETPLERLPNTRWQMRSAALHAGGTASQRASLTPAATLSTSPHPAQPAGRAAEPAQPEQPVGLTDLAEQAEPGERAALILLQDITLLQAIEQLKDEFISLATHELSQPLAVIQGFASMLRVQTARGHGAPLDDWQQEAIGELESAAARLNELTNDLLDVTRIQAGRLQLQLAPQDLVALARRCLAQLQLTTDKHTLTLEAPPVRWCSRRIACASGRCWEIWWGMPSSTARRAGRSR